MKSLLVIIFVLLNFYSCNDNPVKPEKPENRSPVILSLTVFPEIVKPSDSLIVICNAFDPDGDTLVYDWYTGGDIVKIKGLPPWDCCARFNTFENYQVFYAPESRFVSPPQDTFWVECATRDRLGGQDVKLIRFIVKQN